MDFFIENLKEVLEAVNKEIENNVLIISAKRVRKIHDIKSSNR